MTLVDGLSSALLLAATESEPSKAPFYVMGVVLVAWAVAVSALGITRPHFPASRGARRSVLGISAGLVALTLASVVLTS